MKTSTWIALGIIAYLWYVHSSAPPSATVPTSGTGINPGTGPILFDPGMVGVSCNDPSADAILCQMIESSQAESTHVS